MSLNVSTPQRERPGAFLVEELEDAVALHLWEADRVSQSSLGLSQSFEGGIVGSLGTGGQYLKNDHAVRLS